MRKIQIFDRQHKLWDLKNRIRAEIVHLTPEMFYNVHEECLRLFNYIQEAVGWPFIYLIISEKLF